MTLSPEMKDVILGAQKAYARKMWNQALKSAKESLEGHPDVMDVERRRGVLYVAFANGAILKVEPQR